MVMQQKLHNDHVADFSTESRKNETDIICLVHTCQENLERNFFQIACNSIGQAKMNNLLLLVNLTGYLCGCI